MRCLAETTFSSHLALPLVFSVFKRHRPEPPHHRFFLSSFSTQKSRESGKQLCKGMAHISRSQSRSMLPVESCKSQMSEVVFSGSIITQAVEEEDFEIFQQLDVLQVPAWCTAKTQQYRDRITALRAFYDLGEPRLTPVGQTILSHTLTPGFLSIPKDEYHLPNLQISGSQVQDMENFSGIALEKIQETKTRIRALRPLWNSATLVNSMLPVELLMEVFSYLRPDFHRRRGMSILHICRYWTKVMYKTPQFWANLLATHQQVTELPAWKLSRYRLALRHSGNLPLSLSLRGLPIEFADLLRPHAHRIARLHVEMAKAVDGLNLLLKFNMPALKYLSVIPWINKWRISEGTVPPDYVRAPMTLPALRSARLAGGHLTSVILSSLRRLEVTSCWCRECQARDRRFDPLIRALAQCSALEVLLIGKCFPKSSDPATSLAGLYSPDLYAKLPHLTHLTIESERHVAAIILSRLVVPPTVELALYLPGRFKLPSPIDMGSLSAIKTAETVFVNLGDRYRGLHSGIETYIVGRRALRIVGSRKDYDWETSEDRDSFAPDAMRYTQDIADIFTSTQSTVTTLVVIGTLDGWLRRSHDPEPWYILFDTFPALQRLAIGHSSDHPAWILEPLNRPGPDGRCRCPSLRVLRLLWQSEASWPYMRIPDPLSLLYPQDGPPESVRALRPATLRSINGMGLVIRHYTEQEWKEIRSTREQSTTHVETDDMYTWLPYGVTETRVLADTIKAFLALRKELGAAPVTDLCIGILVTPRHKRMRFVDPQSPDDERRDDEYLRRHLPDEPPKVRLARLLEGHVTTLDICLVTFVA